ncbi:Hypothetical protein NTJ_00198 [Nesidiocoris tenuis]|uniref:Uncharacterized protein n=1 Tax=Nesidiocoris tenuis TaxID=355587 RepID=A0ABN7A5M5_9HEMI|nr:Hypothetical protein NTJ_00198 [Nesidiocoris tenuis]
MYAVAVFLVYALASAKGMGIEEWRPMGSGGDPLRDPTNFYSPPQVQHVHYWLKSPSVSLEPPPSRVVGLGQVPGWPQVSSHYIGHKVNFQTPTPVSVTTPGPYVVPSQLTKSPHSPPFVEKNSLLGGPTDNIPIYLKPHIHEATSYFSSSSSSRPLFYTTSHASKRPSFFQQSGFTKPHPMPLTMRPPPHPAPVLSLINPEDKSEEYASPENDSSAALSVENNWPNEPDAPEFVKYISTTIVYETTTTKPTTTATSAPSRPPVSFVIEGHSKVKKYGPLPESSTSIHRVNHNHLITNLVSQNEKDDVDRYNPFRLQ